MDSKDIEKVYEDADILRYLRSKLPPQEVEEVLQESIVSLLKIKNKDNIRNLKNYFFHIVKHEIARYYSKRHDDIELKEDMVVNEEGVDDLEIMIKDYPLLYAKAQGKGWQELGITRSKYYKMIKREKAKLYENICC